MDKLIHATAGTKTELLKSGTGSYKPVNICADQSNATQQSSSYKILSIPELYSGKPRSSRCLQDQQYCAEEALRRKQAEDFAELNQSQTLVLFSKYFSITQNSSDDLKKNYTL